ncbi:MAG: hypothetical protein J6Y25_04450 [Elusimicrobiaceae bacterium]|nr:hypothetical protein [Elusimicrobiaceae bacterium]
MQAFVYEVTAAAKLMNVDTETLKKSAFARYKNGEYYVHTLLVDLWNNGTFTPLSREKLMLPKRRFMEYMTPFLADMSEPELNIMLDAFNILLDELKKESTH